MVRTLTHRSRRAAHRSRTLTSRLHLESLEDRTLLTWSNLDFAGVAAAQRLQDDPTVQAITWQGVDGYARVGQWIAQFDGVTGSAAEQMAAVDARLAPAGLHAAQYLGKPGTVLIEAPAATDFAQLQKALVNVPGYRYAEPNFVEASPLTGIPNDPRFGELYGMHNTGQSISGLGTGTPDADIDAPEAWDITRGSSSLVVANIDSGVDYTHPDLAANIWTNPGEIPGNRADDDGNGFVDDIHGYDFANNDGDPMDDYGHGTHTAGTLGAVGNNGVGVAGAAWNVTIMPVKWIAGNGVGTTAAAVAAVNYVTLMRTRGVNVRVSSNSWHLFGPSQALKDAIAAHGAAGILFVVAAGNDSANRDVVADYPVSYHADLPNMISVAATDNRDLKAGFSAYGRNNVDLGAPGVNVLSTVPTFYASSGYAYASGTSMATPHVAGVAALAWSAFPDASVQRVRDAILGGVDPISALHRDGPAPVATGGRLNALKALQQLNLRVQSTTPGEGDIVTTPPMSFVVRLSDPVVPASVAPGDLTVNGVPADSVDRSDGDRTLTFTYATSPVTAQGLQTLALAEGALTRASDGNTLIPFTASFRYDALRMQVASTDPVAGASVQLPFTTLDLLLNEPVLSDAVQASDLTINQGTVAGVDLLDNNTRVRFTLSGVVTEGTLTAGLAAGAFTDEFGNPSLAFSASYTLDIGTVPYPTPLAPKAPSGSLIYDPTVTGIIGTAGDTDSFTIPLDPGQTITVVADPSATLAPTLELRNPSGMVIATASSGTGLNAVLQTAAVVSGGTYTVTVGGGSGTTGPYSIQIVVNAAVEMESQDGPANNTAASAQSLNASFIALGGGATRGAVLGRADTAGATDHYAFTLTAGDTATLALTSLSAAVVDLRLLRGDGTPVALGAPGSTSVDRAIMDFLAPATDTYYAVVTGTGGTSYSLVVTRNASFDLEANDSRAAAQDLLGAAVGGEQRLLGAVNGVGSTVVLNYTDSGWWNRSGYHDPSNKNYAVGQGGGNILRDFFVFDLAGVTGSIIGAQLRLFNPSNGFSSPDPSETYTLYDVNTPISDLRAYGASRTDIFNDLGGGTSYGARNVSSADNGQLVTVSLNADGMAYLNAQRGGLAAVGGAITTIAGSADQFLFGFTHIGMPTRQIVLTLADPADVYRVTAAASQELRFQTQTPGDGPLEPANSLNPRLRLLDATGTVVAENDNGAPDGRNALLAYTPATAGTYFIEVSSTTAAATQGEYVLSARGATAARPPFQVVGTSVANGSRVRGPVTQLTIDFNDSLLLSSLDAADLTVNGVPATGLTLVDYNTVRFTLPTLAEGTQNVAIVAGAIRDIQGTPLDALALSFYHDITAPRIVASSIQQGALLPTGDRTITLTFSEPMKTANLDSSDVSLYGQYRGISYYPTSLSYDITGTVPTLTYTTLPEDRYSLTLVSGNGAFEDVVGWNLDGEPHFPMPPNASGDGTEGGDFIVDFDLDVTTAPFPGPLAADYPAGSLIHEGAEWGRISFVSDQDTYTLSVDPGQRITVVVGPGADLKPTVELYRVDGTSPVLIGSAGASAAGRHAVLQSVATHDSLGSATPKTYQVRVASAARTTGEYTVHVYLNTAVEPENHGGAGNDSRSSAQDLSPTLVPLSGAVTDSPTGAHPARAAVLGQTDTGGNSYQAAAVRFTFEDISATGRPTLQGVNDQAAWLTTADLAGFRFRLYGAPYDEIGYSSNGLISFSGTNASPWNGDLYYDPYEPTIAAFWDDLHITSSPQSAVYWEVRGSGDDQRLILQWNDVSFGPGDNVDRITFQAVLYERDGSIQLNYLDLASDSPGAEGSSATVGVKDWGTASAPLVLAWDSGPNDYVGSRHSTRLTYTPRQADYYALPLAAGETASLALSTLFGNGMTLDLVDASGALLTTADPGNTWPTALVSSFVAPVAGTYYVRVTGDGYAGDYSLVVTRSADLDAEYNSYPELAQDAPSKGAVGRPWLLGYVDGGDSDFYRITLGPSRTLEVDTTTPGGAGGEFVNGLDPVVRLYRADGSLVLEDDNSAADGRNAHLSYRVPKDGDGTYLVEVAGSPSGSSFGEYTLSLKGADGAVSPFQVTATDPGLGGARYRNLSRITIDFSQAILLSTVQASDLTVDGRPAIDVAVIDRDTLAFTFPRSLSEGTHTVAIASGALRDIHGTPVAAYTDTFFNDLTPPRVVFSSIAPDAVLSPGSLVYTARFSEELDATYLGPWNVELFATSLGSYFGPDSFDYNPTTSTLTVAYSNLPEDTYRLRLLSGDYQFEDLAGWDLDAELTGFGYAASVLGFSSQYSTTEWSAAQALNGPDTFDYADVPTAWAPDPQNGTIEFLALGFATPVRSDGVTIRETQGNGFVTRVEALDVNDVYHTVWAGVDPSQPGAPADFFASWPLTDYLVKGVRITVDTDHDQGSWEEIDAVRLHSPTAVPGGLGNGVEGGSFLVGFTLDVTTAPFPAPLSPIEPQGSLIYDGSATSRIAPAGDTDSFTLSLDADQTVTVIVHPDADLRPTIELRGPTGIVLGSAGATAPGGDAVLQTVAATQAGVYTITIGGATGSTGTCDIYLVLNAAMEGGDNDTPATAQDLAASFTPLLKSATRGAVLGSGEDFSLSYTAAPVSYTFEDIRTTGTPTLAGYDDGYASLSAANLAGFRFHFYGTPYDTISFSSNGLINFGGSYSGYNNGDLTSDPYVATIAAFWDDLYIGGSSQSAVYWEVRGSGDDQRLILQWNDVRFYSGQSSDLITFQAVLSERDGSIQFNYRDLASPDFGAEGRGATVGIKNVGYQGPERLLLSFNSGPNEFVGTGKSTRLTVVPPTPDIYSFPVAAGQYVTLAVTALNYGGTHVALLDPSGTELAASSSGPSNVGQIVYNFGPLTAGAYYARVTGSLGVLYSLVVTRDAVFDREGNNSVATAQPFGGTHIALGYIGGADTADNYSFAAAAGEEIVLFTTTPGDGPGEFTNTLNPTLRLFGPDGREVTVTRTLIDGRNERIVYTVPAAGAGTYTVEVTAEDGTSGEYVLDPVSVRAGEAEGFDTLFLRSGVPAQAEDRRDQAGAGAYGRWAGLVAALLTGRPYEVLSAPAASTTEEASVSVPAPSDVVNGHQRPIGPFRGGEAIAVGPRDLLDQVFSSLADSRWIDPLDHGRTRGHRAGHSPGGLTD